MTKGQALRDRVPMTGEDLRVERWSRLVQVWMDEADAFLKKFSPQASVAFRFATAEPTIHPICHGTREYFLELTMRLRNLEDIVQNPGVHC